MTDEEAKSLNNAVAIAMGWGHTCNLPDFCRSFLGIGYLMEWASKQENVGVYLDNDSKDHAKPWGCNMGDTRSPHRSFCGAGDTAGEAFCRAILEYTEATK